MKNIGLLRVSIILLSVVSLLADNLKIYKSDWTFEEHLLDLHEPEIPSQAHYCLTLF